MTQRYERLVAKLGIKTTIHKLRHYSATELIKAGVDIDAVAGRLGHGGCGTTTLKYYAGWSASSGLFNWVIDYLAGYIDDQPTREQLRLIEEANLRWLNFGDLSFEGQRQVRAVLSREIVQHSERNLIAVATPRFLVRRGGRNGRLYS